MEGIGKQASKCTTFNGRVGKREMEMSSYSFWKALYMKVSPAAAAPPFPSAFSFSSSIEQQQEKVYKSSTTRHACRWRATAMQKRPRLQNDRKDAGRNAR